MCVHIYRVSIAVESGVVRNPTSSQGIRRSVSSALKNAAEACFVSQPTLSTQLKKLETELGVSLFERAPRNILLTPAGERILKHAREALAQVSQMQDIAKHTRDPESASVRLGIFPTLALEKMLMF